MFEMQRLLVLSYLILILPIASQAKTKKETYFACQNGYQFETKKSAARCIKQGRLSIRAPESCGKKSGKYRGFVLSIDLMAQKDMCVGSKKMTKFDSKRQMGSQINDLSMKKLKSFSPLCPLGFKLNIKKGKDVCERDKAETIKPPNKKVTR